MLPVSPAITILAIVLNADNGPVFIAIRRIHMIGRFCKLCRLKFARFACTDPQITVSGLCIVPRLSSRANTPRSEFLGATKLSRFGHVGGAWTNVPKRLSVVVTSHHKVHGHPALAALPEVSLTPRISPNQLSREDPSWLQLEPVARAGRSVAAGSAEKVNRRVMDPARITTAIPSPNGCRPRAAPRNRHAFCC